MGAFLRLNSNPNPNGNPNPNPNPNFNPNPNRNPIQNALLYISFCVARKKLDNRVLGHDSIKLTFVRMSTKSRDTRLIDRRELCYY